MSLYEILTKIVHHKNGVEIGGPSSTAVDDIYNLVDNIDNVIFSNNTVWSVHDKEYHFRKNKVGHVIINDATDINLVENETYDFCFASHCLEHIANPIKALKEWLRIIKNNGHIILILPEKSVCFDHKRNYSKFSTILSAYEKNVNEDDLSTLPEILANHDLTMDLAAGDFAQFTQRSLNNIDNRCLHHYVYNPSLLMEICNYLDCEFIGTETHGLDIWFIMKKKMILEMKGYTD